MKDEKNKQLQPQQSQSDMEHKKGSEQPVQGKQSSDQQTQGRQSSDQSGKHPTGQHPTGQHPAEDPSRTSQHQPHKSGIGQPKDAGEGDRRSDIENPDQQEQPGKKVNVDDDPDQTTKKVPNMHK